MGTAYVSLGSNTGDSRAYLEEAIRRISSHSVIVATSSLYSTEPVSNVPQAWFLNCVLQLSTTLSPHELLHTALSIEKDLGRIRTITDGPRTIDIDILLYDDLIISEERLTIPHPRLHERRFVLVPLNQISPHLVHPLLREDIATLLTNTDDTSTVTLA